MRSLRVSVVLAVCCLIVACAAKVPELTRSKAADLIRSSSAFHEPIDPGIVFIDTEFHPGPTTQRELLRLADAIEFKNDGPWAIAGRTATVEFTWRWTEGPYAGFVLRSRAKFNCASGGEWRVYDDLLKHDLWRAERGGSE